MMVCTRDNSQNNENVSDGGVTDGGRGEGKATLGGRYSLLFKCTGMQY